MSFLIRLLIIFFFIKVSLCFDIVHYLFLLLLQGGKYVISFYSGNHIAALISLFPEITFDKSKFQCMILLSQQSLPLFNSLSSYPLSFFNILLQVIIGKLNFLPNLDNQKDLMLWLPTIGTPSQRETFYLSRHVFFFYFHSFLSSFSLNSLICYY